MAAIDDIWLAALTKEEDDAASKNQFNLTVNIDGGDVFAHDFMLGWNVQGQPIGLRDGHAGLEEATPPAPFDSDKLSNSSVRLLPWRKRRVGAERWLSSDGRSTQLSSSTRKSSESLRRSRRKSPVKRSLLHNTSKRRALRSSI